MRSGVRVCCMWLCLAAGLAASSAAQTPAVDPGLRGRTHAGFGYVVNLPRQMLGFNAYVMSPALRYWGFFADYKKTTDSRRDDFTYDPDLTVEDAEGFNDLLRKTESEWQSVNAGVIRIVSPALALYAGAGWSKEEVLRRYFDSSLTRGVQGIYWVDDAGASGTRVNVMGGAWFRILPNFLVQFGVEAAPRGATVGVSYVIPFSR